MLLKGLLFLFLGCTTGTLSRLLGIGGGSLITPALIYLFGFSQHIAQGTTLALLIPPIGLMGSWTYYQQGYVNLKVGIILCVGFFNFLLSSNEVKYDYFNQDEQNGDQIQFRSIC